MKINWGVSIGIVYVLFALSMILFVIKASRQNNDLVTENYYDDAVHYQDKIDAKNNSERFNSDFKAVYSESENRVLITMSNSTGKLSGKLKFYKPDNAQKDFEVDLMTDAAGRQHVSADKMSKGLWHVKASWQIDETRYYSESNLFIQ